MNPFRVISFILLTSFIILQSCCLNDHSGCQTCDSTYTKLNEASREWINPYQDLNSVVFMNQEKSDTLDFSVILDTVAVYCGGGDECMDRCEAENVIIYTDSYIMSLGLASYNDKLQVNYSLRGIREIDGEIGLWLDFETLTLRNFQNFISSEFFSNYSWNNQELTVLQIDCLNPTNCELYQRILISKEIGIIEFTDPQGQQWHLVE